MATPLAPAAVPAEAWSLLRRLSEIEAERGALLRFGLPLGRGDLAVFRRMRLRELTTEALHRAARLKALGVDPTAAPIADAPPTRQYRED